MIQSDRLRSSITFGVSSLVEELRLSHRDRNVQDICRLMIDDLREYIADLDAAEYRQSEEIL